MIFHFTSHISTYQCERKKRENYLIRWRMNERQEQNNSCSYLPVKNVFVPMMKILNLFLLFNFQGCGFSFIIHFVGQSSHTSGTQRCVVLIPHFDNFFILITNESQNFYISFHKMSHVKHLQTNNSRLAASACSSGSVLTGGSSRKTVFI